VGSASGGNTTPENARGEGTITAAARLWLYHRHRASPSGTTQQELFQAKSVVGSEPVRPRKCDRPRKVRRVRGAVRQSGARLAHGGELAEPPVLLRRRHDRHAGWRVARDLPADHGGDALALHLRAAAGLRPHHAGGHFLWRAVRKLDRRHSRQRSRRDLLDHHLPRRPPDGPAGPRRLRARDRRHRLVLRRHDRDRRHSAAQPAARRLRPQVHGGRDRQPHRSRPARRGRAGARLAPQGDRHDRGRRARRPGRSTSIPGYRA
jgi:hypothetical protein